MKPRALTPLFQLWSRHAAAQAPEGVLSYPAPASGNHAREAVFLALATALLTASAVVPLTAGIGWPWLRWPVVVILLFLGPHLVMGLISLVSGVVAGRRWHRGVVQDWSCLVGMTAYAAGQASAAGWVGSVCQAWLGFMGLNALIGLVGWALGMTDVSA